MLKVSVLETFVLNSTKFGSHLIQLFKPSKIEILNVVLLCFLDLATDALKQGKFFFILTQYNYN